jgi:hypothetical protein
MQSLPDMIEKAHDPQLKQRLHSHLGETINHIDRLEDVFSLYGTDPRHLNCPAIDGIIAEAEDMTGEADAQAIDAAITAAAQALDHYEITRYGSPGRSASSARTARRSSSRTSRKSRRRTNASPNWPNATPTCARRERRCKGRARIRALGEIRSRDHEMIVRTSERGLMPKRPKASMLRD